MTICGLILNVLVLKVYTTEDGNKSETQPIGIKTKTK